MTEIRVILISSVLPEPTSAGQITLHRHLVERAGICLEQYRCQTENDDCKSVFWRAVQRIKSTRFSRYAEDLMVFKNECWIDSISPRKSIQAGRTVVLTVAHAGGCRAALRFAQKNNLPLVTFFHDWWPDIPNVHSPFRRRLASQFLELYRRSNAALCVCEGMKSALGENPRATVLFPIPKNAPLLPPITKTQAGSKRFRVYYFGNLFEYGPMLAMALKAAGKNKKLCFEVRGANPNWPAEYRESMKANGLWKDFAPRSELDSWLAEADAFLIPMVFDAQFRRRMESSFPSKMIEFAQFGKPLVIWGPEYCSAVRWASNGDRGLCVTDPSPCVLVEAIENLAESPPQQRHYAMAASESARDEFNPDRIHAQFLAELEKALSHSS